MIVAPAECDRVFFLSKNCFQSAAHLKSYKRAPSSVNFSEPESDKNLVEISNLNLNSSAMQNFTFDKEDARRLFFFYF